MSKFKVIAFTYKTVAQSESKYLATSFGCKCLDASSDC